MVQEVETNRLIHLYTPLFFGWTISFKEKIFCKCHFPFKEKDLCPLADAIVPKEKETKCFK
jgi:hypothetical protein